MRCRRLLGCWWQASPLISVQRVSTLTSKIGDMGNGETRPDVGIGMGLASPPVGDGDVVGTGSEGEEKGKNLCCAERVTSVMAL